MSNLKKQMKLEAEEVLEALIKFAIYLKNGIKNNFKILLLFTALLFFSVNGRNQKINDSGLNNEITTDISKQYIYVQSVKYRANIQLISEVERYINKLAPDSKIDAKHLVKVCQQYDLDLVFVLAQGILESNFGTKGKASETNSVFNVGTYDDGTILYRYKNPNESIEPYAILLNNRYLSDKNLVALLQDYGYTNADGKRFASEKRYENRLRNLMIKIDIETSISMLQGIIDLNYDEILTYFGPIEEQIQFTDLQVNK